MRPVISDWQIETDLSIYTKLDCGNWYCTCRECEVCWLMKDQWIINMGYNRAVHYSEGINYKS